MKKSPLSLMIFLFTIAVSILIAAIVVPPVIEQPGTQPREVSNLETPDKCDNCHGGYNSAIEPAFNWRGSMMANAGRDPIFWATLAIAEQDFDGAGDLCIRCHSTAGWLGGRSTPTDGSSLAAGDADGVECDFCHKLTNPDNSEHIGVQNPPYVANDEGTPPTGYYGSGMASIWDGNEKLGPYVDTIARHQFIQSRFHRGVEFCGTCHDVSNPAVGHLAPNHGIQDTADPVNTTGPRNNGLVAFNNFPYQYGIVERTYSEFESGRLSTTPVSQYLNLPIELQAGAIKAAYESASVAGTGGNYADNTIRYFSCQTCHLRPVNGIGCNKKGALVRKDLPLHDMTGGNYWMPDAIKYLDSKGMLRLGGGLSSVQIAALDNGKIRAIKQLSEAATLVVDGNNLKVINHTAHKLISGYPEGRRMWLNIKWYDKDEILLREDGKYGPLTVKIDGVDTQVNTILDLHDPNTKIYEAHYGMTQEWSFELINAHAYSPSLILSYNRITGNPDFTLDQLASSAPGSYHETFHFALNNTVVKDNRIPTYMMSYEEARMRNALPVPADQYGGSPGGFYDHFDVLAMNPPHGAVYATINLLYQPTSWEYIQFLYLNNWGKTVFLANEGAYLLEAWLNTGMAAPYTMASTTWGKKPTPQLKDLLVDSLTTWALGKRDTLTQSDTFRRGDTVVIIAHNFEPVDTLPISLDGAQVFLEVRDSGNKLVSSLQGFSDIDGNAILKWKTFRTTAAGIYTAQIIDVIKSGYQFDPARSTTTVIFIVQ
ncbi:MAG: hypothetical protein GTN73_00045 [Candidatus Aminicenantes bacterium]|nr:hypothetical protein [Candidatus Aminicenantes bacterium]